MDDHAWHILDGSLGWSVKFNIDPVVSYKSDGDTLKWHLKSKNSQIKFSHEDGRQFSRSIDLDFAEIITEAIRKLVVAYSAIPMSAPSMIDENVMWYLPEPSDSRRVQTEEYNRDRYGIRDHGTKTTAISELENRATISRGEGAVHVTRVMVTVEWPNLR